MPADPAGAAAALRERFVDGDLPVSLARLYAQHVRLRNGQEPLSFEHTEIEQRLFDAVRLIEAARIRGDGDTWEPGLRRAGEVLEWLAQSGLNTEGLPLSLLSAAAYQLAGYPARARTLISDRPRAESESPMLDALLAADFRRLLPLASGVAATPPRSAERRASEGFARREAQSTYLLERIIGEMASALGVIAASLRWPGEARTGAALEKLTHVGSALVHFADPYIWLLVTLSAEVAARAVDDSLRNAMSGLAARATPGARDALERYARLGFQNGQVLAWPSQRRGFERLSGEDSFALCTPTGSGKTRVAEVALLDALFQEPDDPLSAPLCLYVVPSRALAAEVEAKLSRVLRDAGGPRAVTVTSLYGGSDWGASDEWVSGESPTVLICTQEKAEALVRFLGWLLLGRLNLVIVDEAHSIQFDGDQKDLRGFDSRSLRLEALVATLRARRPDVRLIAMSAVAKQLETPLGQWVSGEEDSHAVTVDYRSTRQVIGRLHMLGSGRTRIEYDLLDGKPLTVGRAGDSRPFVPNPFPPRPSPGRLTGTKQNPATHALWAAMHLASGGHEIAGQTVLVSIAEGINDYALWWLELLEDIWQNETLPEFWRPPGKEDDVLLWERTLAMTRDLFREDSREYRLLKHGIVVHHGKMPGRLPRLLTMVAERELARVVLATSTLSEGVNLPVQTVLLPSMWRFADDRPMSPREFANLAGRAGRPGLATEGQTLVLIRGGNASNSAQRRTYDATIAALQGTEDSSGARSALAELMQLVRELWAGDEGSLWDWLETTAPTTVVSPDDATEALDALDAVLLAALEDSRIDADAEENLRQFWQASFARRAADEEERLGRLFVHRGASLLQNVFPEQEERTTLYRTSLPPREASTLLALMPSLLEHLRSGSDYGRWSEHQRFEYVADAMDLVSRVERFRIPDRVTKRKGAASARNVLAWWLGDPEAPDEPSAAQISTWHNFLQQEVRYKFTWGLGAALAVAIQDTPTEGLTAGDWVAAGIPWAAVWIRDLLTWGLLDPVAAFVLARRHADTRADAAVRASSFYEQGLDLNTDIYDIKVILEWARTSLPDQRPSLPATRRRPIAVRLSRRMREAPDQRVLRVIPLADGEGVRWLDPSGVELATSELGGAWLRRASRLDFTLHPKRSIVRIDRYV
ncbi:DEAD/DEAH box helicase [Baekduia sp. Peel2402]|uniref:DEAD/DEAH box helicase n=1 Tax=Baekduia sp. Peel2402 TaxID=3458296 RepID=UPI00403E6D05